MGFLRCVASKHVFRMNWCEQNFIFLRLCFVPRVRLKFSEQRGSLLSFLFVGWMDCAAPLWAACKSVLSAQWTAFWSMIIIFFNPPVILAFFLSEIPTARRHWTQIFPGFYVIVFEKGSRRTPWTRRETPWCASNMEATLGPWAWSCFTHWWNGLAWRAHGAGWWGQIRGKNKRYDANKHSRTHPSPHPPHAFTLTSSLMQCVIPVFTPSDC